MLCGMDDFRYRDGALYCEEVAIEKVAEAFGTPTYLYSRRTLLDNYDRLAAAFAELEPEICFSIKSCHNLHVLRLLRERGAAFDAVSGGEVRRAIEAGADPARIVFAGVGKTQAEIREAIAAEVGCFNVESAAEFEVLSDCAAEAGRPVRASLRINPDVDPNTHAYVTTGKRENKFGVDLETARAVFTRARSDAQVRLSGIHLHIGSMVNSVEPYVAAISKALAFIDELRRGGHAIDLLNIGGGYGAPYQGSESPAPADYAARIVPLLRGLGLKVHLEPGRSISASAGILLTRVLYVKPSPERRFVIVDAAMTDLLRPALYGAYHFVWPAHPGSDWVPPHHGADLKLSGTQCVDVVGPVCESADFLAKDRWLPPVQAGDLLAVFTAGAYGAVMSSQYNSRARAAEVLVEGAAMRLIRRRETYDDLVAAERDAVARPDVHRDCP